MIKVIKNGFVITMNEKKEMKKCDIVIKDNIILDVCDNYTGEVDKLIDASGLIVMPGLINAHTHLGMSIFRNTNSGLDLMHWLNDLIWPIEDKMSDEDVMYANMLSCVEAIKTGTTTVNDMYFGVKALDGITSTGIRCVYTRTLSGNVDDKVREFEELVSNYKNDLVTFTVSPHSLYTCSSDLLKCVKSLSDKYNLPIHIHFCENEDEVKQVKSKFNMNPVSVLDYFGFLDNKLILAHGVFIDDFELINRSNISIVHNIVSNLNLGCGVFPIKKYLDTNVNLCLGTDGVGSGFSMDMFNTMSFTSLVCKGFYKDPLSIDNYKILQMATIGGAKALGLENEVGSLEKGKKADIILLDINNIESLPINNLVSHLVHNIKPSNVKTTIINGNIVMENRKLLNVDEEYLKVQINEIIKKLNTDGE